MQHKVKNVAIQLLRRLLYYNSLTDSLVLGVRVNYDKDGNLAYTSVLYQETSHSREQKFLRVSTWAISKNKLHPILTFNSVVSASHVKPASMGLVLFSVKE